MMNLWKANTVREEGDISSDTWCADGPVGENEHQGACVTEDSGSKSRIALQN